jgi:hypothetical protein
MICGMENLKKLLKEELTKKIKDEESLAQEWLIKGEPEISMQHMYAAQEFRKMIDKWLA